MNRRTLIHTGLGVLGSAIVAPPASGTLGAVAGSGDDGLAPGAALAQGQSGAQSKALGAFPLGDGFAGWQGTMIEVTYPPGASSAAHQHPGPTFGYVVRGSIRWAINGEPARVIEAGGSFFEPTGSVHSTAANASTTEPAVLSVVILGKEGEPLSRPASRPGGPAS
jgi:quercetin dioxygenase-like cupin family protein